MPSTKYKSGVNRIHMVIEYKGEKIESNSTTGRTCMIDAGVLEASCIITLLVEPNHQSNVLALKVRDVMVRRKRVVPFHRHLCRLVWAGEGQELAVPAPVQVAVLHLFEMLILVDVKIVEIEIVKLPRLIKASQRVQD